MGHSVKRKEDALFFQDKGNYTDDVKLLTDALSGSLGDENGLEAIKKLIANGNLAVEELTALIRENRNSLRISTTSMQKTMQAVETELPAILRELRQASREVSQLVHDNRKDIAEFTSELHEIARAGILCRGQSNY